MQWIDTVIGLVTGGGLVGVFTIPSAIRKAKAEAKEPEIDGWKKLVDELQEQNAELRERVKSNENRIDELNSRIDDVYKLLGDERREKNELLAKVTKLEAQIEIEQPKLCNVHDCPNRESVPTQK